MRTTRWLALVLMMPVLAFGVSLSGCSKGDKKNEVAKGSEGKGTDTPKSSEGKHEEPITAKTDGVIKGHVTFDGEPPAPVSLLDRMQKHENKDICLMGPESERIEQTWIIGKDKGVANVIVFLKPPAGKKFVVPDDDKAKDVTLDQPHCAFVPHVVALCPEAGQKLVVKNSSKASHNTKIAGDPSKNSAQDFTLPPGDSSKPLALTYQRAPLTVACNIHPWMGGRIVTLNQPLYAVTNGDGYFEIHGVPSGVEVTVMAMHESIDDLKKPREEKKLTVTSGDNTVDFKIGAK